MFQGTFWRYKLNTTGIQNKSFYCTALTPQPSLDTRNQLNNVNYIYIHMPNFFDIHIYIYVYIYVNLRSSKTRKNKKHDMSELFQTTAASRMKTLFFQAGKGIAFDMRRSCPTPTTPLRQYRGRTEVSPLWTPKMRSSWIQVVKRHLQDWTLTELGHTSLLFGLPHLRMRTDAQSACYQAGENKI